MPTVESQSIGLLPIDWGGFGSIHGSIQSASVLWKNFWIDPRIDPALIARSSSVPIDPLIEWDLWIDPPIDPEGFCSWGLT